MNTYCWFILGVVMFVMEILHSDNVVQSLYFMTMTLFCFGVMSIIDAINRSKND